jgi:hypothetical protein
VLVAGVIWGQGTGLYIGLAAFGLGMLVQTAWLWVRSRPVVRAAQTREAGAVAFQSTDASDH